MLPIERFLFSSAVLAVAVASSSPRLPAQSGTTTSPVASLERPKGAVVVEKAPSCCNSKLTAAEEGMLARRIEEADAFITQGRMTEARSILRGVIEDQGRGDAYPAKAMRRLANVEFALDRPVVAASVLVDLADIAAEVADPQTELQALVDAMVLYDQNGRRAQVRELRPRVRRLLDSPAISEETRRSLARTLDPG